MTELSQEAVTQIRLLREQVELMTNRVSDAEDKTTHLHTILVSKEELRARRVQTFTVSFVVAALLLILVLPAALHRYEHNYNTLVTKCFLTPSQTGAPSSVCAKKFPGYAQARAQSEQNLATFQALIADVPVNKSRIETLEKQVAQLQGAKQ
jgi:hypothetical protein